MSSDHKGIETTLSSLHISKPSKSSTSKAKEPRIADSWEQDTDSDTSSESDAAQARQPPSAYPNAPPPTPISPATPYTGSSSTTDIAERFSDWSPNSQSPIVDRPSDARTGGREAAMPERRQEKTDAVARRLIVGALGLKAPKKTEEQRAYDRAVREKEMRRRNGEKEEEERRRVEAERAKASVWED